MPSVGLGQPPPPPPPTGSTAARRFGLTDVEAFKAGRDHSYMYAVPLWNDESPTTPRPSMRPAQEQLPKVKLDFVSQLPFAAMLRNVLPRLHL